MVKIAAFLQLYNESSNGHLVRCLNNCAQWADDIFIYDDCSTDDSEEIYKRYTDNVILGQKRDFVNELFHKQDLLEFAQTSNPDWIIWQDGDAILSRDLTRDLRDMLSDMGKYDGLRVHYMNLWRHPAFQRLDHGFDSLAPLMAWKNKSTLRYEPVKGLHRRQYPKGITKSRNVSDNYRVLHYGFASEYWIVKKYLTYKSHGQWGDNLRRLVDETTSFRLEKVPKEMFPEGNLPLDYDTVSPPEPITYDQYKSYKSWEEYESNSSGNGLQVPELP